MILNPFSRFFFVIVIVAMTFAYSHYKKSNLDSYLAKPGDLLLKQVPKITVQDLYSDTPIFVKDLTKDYKGMMVHFWGTWCAPCEAELPSFLEMTKKLNQLNFLILAVNDDAKKAKKFLKRFGEIPDNIRFGIDNSGKSMELMGTLKVPETYLFNSDGRHVKKFVGPQDWHQSSYVQRVRQMLSL